MFRLLMPRTEALVIMDRYTQAERVKEIIKINKSDQP